jgi:hypothetical protein
VFRQVRIGFALRHDSFKVLFARQPEQPLAIRVDVVAKEEPFATLGHYCMQPEFAVNQWQIPQVFTISESAVFFLIVRFGVFIPENVESVKERLSAYG